MSMFTPPMMAPHRAKTDSYAAWASRAFAAQTFDERYGTPYRRASWPPTIAVRMYSGVPNAGAPDCMSTFEVKPPYTTGAPGRTTWVRTIPASASAFCSASAPASADDFLAQWVPLIRKSPGFKHDGLVIITFGEAQPPEGAADPKRVGALLLSPYVTPGATDATAYNPYSVLRTTEDLFAIAPLVYAGSSETNSFSAGLLGGD